MWWRCGRKASSAHKHSMSKMPLTRKTPQEFEERTLDWAIFRAPNLKIDFMGHIVPPNAVPHGYPLRRSALTHQPDSHVFEDTREVKSTRL